MSWSCGAGINVAQIQRHEVDVLHHQARKVFFQSELKIDTNHYSTSSFDVTSTLTYLCTNIKELGTIKWSLVVLLDDKYLVVDILLAQIIMDVIKELVELTGSVSVRNNHSS